MTDDIASGRRPQPHPDDEDYSARHYPNAAAPNPAAQWGAEQPGAEQPAITPVSTHPPVLGSDALPVAVPPTMSIDLGDAAEGWPPYGQAPYEQPAYEQPAPPLDPAGRTSTAMETVTCPECGATQQVYLNRRDASDFCTRCDFPLFWTPSRVERDRAAASQGESLRRLPGTAGSYSLASARCPHCAEPNPVRAEICIRCGRSMHPVPLAPVVVAPPPPPPPVVVAPVPEPRTAWWVWLLLGLALAAAVAVVVLVLTGVIG